MAIRPACSSNGGLATKSDFRLQSLVVRELEDSIVRVPGTLLFYWPIPINIRGRHGGYG
jgi:hypothetical protein